MTFSAKSTLRNQAKINSNPKPELVALMQRSIDGTFYFSSPAPKEIVDGISKREISKIRILPSASLGRVSNLGACSGRPVQRRGVFKKNQSHGKNY